MPELPEVETIVNELKPRFLGRRLRRIDVLWPRTISGDVSQFCELLSGTVINRVYRKGKYICLNCNRVRLTIHLRMTGKLLIDPIDVSETHVRVRFVFSDKLTLNFHDVRKFGRMRIWSEDDELLPGIGPDALDAEKVADLILLQDKSRAIKAVLLDQAFIAGVGNIYADEALFLSRIHPGRQARSLTSGERIFLAQNLNSVLVSAIKRMGTTLADYQRPDSSRGINQNFLKVYGRSGETCLDCGSTLEKIRVGSRGTTLCPVCQK